MNPVAFSVQAYQWGANCEILKPSQEKDYLKISLRIFFIVGVSLVIAPIGIIYNLAMAIFKKLQSFRSESREVLSNQAWHYSVASGTDLISLFRGAFSCIGLVLIFFPLGLIRSIPQNDLRGTLNNVFGLLAGALLIVEGHMLKGFKNLNNISISLQTDSFEKVNHIAVLALGLFQHLPQRR